VKTPCSQKTSEKTARLSSATAGTISLQLETFQALLADICRSIHANGFHRIITVNGHGGNAAPCRAVSWKLAEEDVFTISSGVKEA